MSKETKELNLFQKLAAITEEVGNIEKTGRNSQQGYQFIEQSHVVAALRPLLAKYCVVIVPETVKHGVERFENARGTNMVHALVGSRYHIINGDKPDEVFTVEWAGEALDSSDKATNKAMTASEKYFYMKLFKISDKDDADADSPETPAPRASSGRVPSDPQKNLIRVLSRQLGHKEDAVEARIKQLATSAEASEAIEKLQALINEGQSNA